MKQIFTLTFLLLNLINLDSQAMFRRPAILVKQTAIARLSSTSVCPDPHKELELAILNGQLEQAKKLMRYHWIDPKHKNSAGLTIRDLISRSSLPKETRTELECYYSRASYNYIEDVSCGSARDYQGSVRLCYSDCMSHCKHAHNRLERAIRDGDVEQIRPIMKYQWVNLEISNHDGKLIPQQAKESKHPAVVTLFESYHNETN